MQPKGDRRPLPVSHQYEVRIGDRTVSWYSNLDTAVATAFMNHRDMAHVVGEGGRVSLNPDQVRLHYLTYCAPKIGWQVRIQ